jgi:hypothetical protein
MASNTRPPAQAENYQLTQDDTDWVDVNNSLTNNALYAQNSFDSGQGATTSYLICTDFEFNIPTSATIDGISVSIEKYRDSGDDISDESVYLFSSVGTSVGSNKAAAGLWSTSPTVTTYGGPTDMWGTSLTTGDINNADFGIGIRAEAEFSGYGSSEAYIDYVEMTVFYTESSGGVKFGSSSIQKIFFGSTEINKVMFGSSQVF